MFFISKVCIKLVALRINRYPAFNLSPTPSCSCEEYVRGWRSVQRNYSSASFWWNHSLMRLYKWQLLAAEAFFSPQAFGLQVVGQDFEVSDRLRRVQSQAVHSLVQTQRQDVAVQELDRVDENTRRYGGVAEGPARSERCQSIIYYFKLAAMNDGLQFKTSHCLFAI